MIDCKTQFNRLKQILTWNKFSCKSRHYIYNKYLINKSGTIQGVLKNWKKKIINNKVSLKI